MLIDGQPAIRNQAVRERIADWYAKAQGLKFTKFRTITALSRGETPGPENSIHKLVNASKLQDIASYGMDLMGEAGMVIDDDLVEAWGMFQSALLSSPSARIAGGSDEIFCSNIIAERVLWAAEGGCQDRTRTGHSIPSRPTANNAARRFSPTRGGAAALCAEILRTRQPPPGVPRDRDGSGRRR